MSNKQLDPVTPPGPRQMPPELEQYRDLIADTGGNTVEELLDRFRSDPRLIQTNLPVYLMAARVDAQIRLLRRLHRDGHLNPPTASVAAPS